MAAKKRKSTATVTKHVRVKGHTRTIKVKRKK
jgi:hypothetical protein